MGKTASCAAMALTVGSYVLLFFAFAGYARIATLGEEVGDAARTIPRAIPLALGIALAVTGPRDRGGGAGGFRAVKAIPLFEEEH